LSNARARLVCDEVRVNRQGPVIISLVAPAPASPLTDNSTPDLSFRRTANDEGTGTLCVKSSSHQGDPQSVSSVNRSLERSGPQHRMPEVKLNEPSTAVLASQVGQKLEEPMLVKESNHQDSISSDTNGRAMLTQGVCTLDGIREKVFEHSEVVVKDERPLEKRRAKRNHVEVRWEEKNVKNPFIIKGQVAGHLARIQIDSGLDLDCILERFVKRYNLLTIKHPDLVRVRGFNGEIVGVVDRQTEVPVTLKEVRVGRLRLDLVTTDVDVILGVKWLRRNRPQFGWENNSLKWKRKEIPFEEKRLLTVRIVESTVKKFARTVRKESTIFMVSVKSIIEEEEVVVKNVVKLLKEYKDVFSVKSPPDLPPKRGEDDHAIPTVPRVRL
jgi:Retroviral aspartyl protease